MDLNEILVFAEVAKAGSFTRAARALSMSKSTVSEKVAALERRLNARLLHRTTRALALTEAGRTWLAHGARILSAVQEAEHAMTSLQAAPSGLLRITTPFNFAGFTSVLSGYLARYPQVRIDLVCTDRPVNLVAEGFDLAVRMGHLADSTLVARRIGAHESHLVASPGYLDARGRPRTVEALSTHAALVFAGGERASTWRLQSGRRTAALEPVARLVANDLEIIRQASRDGLGVALLPEELCAADLAAGRLERVLPRWAAPGVPLHVLHPSARQLDPKVRAFIDHIGSRRG